MSQCVGLFASSLYDNRLFPLHFAMVFFVFKLLTNPVPLQYDKGRIITEEIIV